MTLKILQTKQPSQYSAPTGSPHPSDLDSESACDYLSPFHIVYSICIRNEKAYELINWNQKIVID
jgi:hypothetical protein